MKQNLLITQMYEEFHAFFKMNMLLWKIKENFKNIICVLPRNATDVVSECDKFIVFDDYILNDIHPSNKETIEQKAVKKYSDDFETVYYTNEKLVNLKTGKDFLPETYTVPSLGDSFKRDQPWMFEWIRAGNYLLPTESEFYASVKKYEELIKKITNGRKTFIFFTRNLPRKMTCFNTNNNFLNFIDFFKEMLKEFNLINAGFPCFPTDINDPNYHEINLTRQSELFALNHYTDGLLMSGITGASFINAASNCDFFLLTTESLFISNDSQCSACNDRKPGSFTDLKEFRIGPKQTYPDWEIIRIPELIELLRGHEKGSTELMFRKEKEFIEI